MARAGILTCSNTTHDVACSSFGCLNDVNHNKEGFDLLDNAQIEKKHKIIIACSVFEKELQACLPVEGKPEIIWIYAGLHADLPRLEE